MPVAQKKTGQKSGARPAAKRQTTAGKARQKTASGADAAQIKSHGKRQASAVVLFAAALLLLAIVFIEGPAIWSFFQNILFGFFGTCSYFLPCILIYIAVMAALDKSYVNISVKLWQSVILVILICSAIHIFAAQDMEQDGFFSAIGTLFDKGKTSINGGVWGGLTGIPLIALFGSVGAKIIISLLIFVFLMLITGTTLIAFFKGIARPVQKIRQSANESFGRKQTEQRNQSKFNIDIPLDFEDQLPDHPVHSDRPERSEKLDTLLKLASDDDIPSDPIDQSKVNFDDLVEKAAKPTVKGKAAVQQQTLFDAKNEVPLKGREVDGYIFPPVALLDESELYNDNFVQQELKANGDKLVDTLRSFGVETRIIDISRGPTVTRYELQPSAGVKISKITGLADDIALNLASSGVRIEAPIPNKPAVGIEVPNKHINMVKFREMVESSAFISAKSKTTIALGRDISGKVTVGDIAKMPHTLIAGATGSGKSVCINSIILSLLYKATPDEVKLIMIDPKVVELGVYNGIPHLLVPVVTDPRKAAGALGWAVTEMLNRYKIFASHNVRDVGAYNALCKSREDLKRLPQIVIIIDELADLMMVAPNEVEDAICRLAQMARAAGMHLIIATQRPSVDVITGIIKANIPSRVAFAVSSQVDSRTILDGAGAEKLLGKGDMLYAPIGSPKPTRIQGCFVSNHEVESVVEYIKKAHENDYDETVMQEIENQAVKDKGAVSEDSDVNDEMMPAAIECVVEAGQASTSLLQRRLRLGYARAGRIIDQMEQRGIVGPHEGSKPRQVLITRQQWLEMNMNKPEA